MKTTLKMRLMLWVLLTAGPSVMAGEPVYPAAEWEARKPEQSGMSMEKLAALAELIGGDGCVVRYGSMIFSWGDASKTRDMASASKPVTSTLLLLAVQEGKLRGVDEKVAEFEPGLANLNAGKDAGITWRHLASQTSGYGLGEPPGAAYGYNDFALAMYYEVLTRKVFKEPGTSVLKTRVGDVLGFQDEYRINEDERPGRLAISVRDMARIGLLYLRNGRWNDQQVLRPELVAMAIGSPLDARTPLAGAQEAAMLPGQKSIGGGKRITPIGPGFYSFNWWLNRTDRQGRRLFVDAPPDTFVASGHGGKRMLWVIPSLDLIVCWNDTLADDMDSSPGQTETRCNRAAKLMREAVLDAPHPFTPRTAVSIADGRWHLNGQVTYPGAKAEGLLMNVRMVNAVFEDRTRSDFDPEANSDEFIAAIPEYVSHGVRAFTLNLQGGVPGYEGAVNSAFDAEGGLREPYMRRVRRVIEACDRHGAVVILGCFYQRQDQVLRDERAVRAAVVNTSKWVHERGFTNVVLEIANEYPHDGFDHALLKTPQGEAELIGLAKRAAPGLLVSTSGIGDGRLDQPVAEASDFLLIHFNGVPLKEIGPKVNGFKRYGKPIVCNEDDKLGADAARAAELSVEHGASWGLMLLKLNQHDPFTFGGAADDPVVYAALKRLTSP